MKSITLRNVLVVLWGSAIIGTNLHAQAVPATGAPQQNRPRIFQNLNLTDTQKAQIKQIRENTPKGKERRQEIMAILTPEQQAQAKQDAQQWKEQHE